MTMKKKTVYQPVACVCGTFNLIAVYLLHVTLKKLYKNKLYCLQVRFVNLTNKIC